MIWDKSFEKQMSQGKVELFSSFFSAIQSFVKEMITNTSRGLKNIEMGNFVINITAVQKAALEIVAITDKGDERSLNKVLPKMIKLLEDHKELFIDWDGDKGRYRVLDLEILQIIQAEKQLMGSKSLIDGQNDIINTIIDQMPELEKNQKDKYLEERTFLHNRLQTTTNLIKKLEILDSIDNISQKLKDKPEIEKGVQLRKKIVSEINSTKQKIVFFLSNAKQAISKTVDKLSGKPLHELDYKDAYLNLYSFSTKLKIIGRDELSDEYRELAQTLIDKPQEKLGEFSKTISRILSLSEDPESYIN
jgi:hypothetical protein